MMADRMSRYARQARVVKWVLGGPMGGRMRSQRLYRRIYGIALRGRGYGASDIDGSGELALLDRLRSQRPGIKVILDVGANVGEWSRAAAERWPTAAIHAFEPGRVTFTALTSAVNDLSIRCNNAAVGERPGTAALHSIPGQPGMSSLHNRDLAHHGLEMTEVEQVQVASLDEYCEQHGIDHIDFLKIDTEGHELAVLLGAARMLNSGRVDFIQFEFGGTNIDARTYLRDFVRLLEPRYRISRILRDGVEPLTYSEAEEVFVTTNFLAERVS